MGRKRNRAKKKRTHWERRQERGVIAGRTDGIKTVGADPDTPENKSTNFTFIIPEEIHKKVMYWIDKASPNEVSGFGNLHFDEELREFIVSDAYLLAQEVSGGSAEMDDAAINKAMFQNKDVPNALKWHWHSHPTFGVFWSGTDMNLIRQLGQQGWILATVFNCKRESRTAFLTSVDVMGKPHDIFVDDIETKVHTVHDQAQQAIFDAEYDTKVRVKTFKQWTPADTTRTPKTQSFNEMDWQRYMRAKEKNPSLMYSDWIDLHGDYEKRGSLYWKDDTPIVTGKRLPMPQSIQAKSYDRYGFATVDGVEIYNPLMDEDCKNGGEDLLFAMISDMSEEEIRFLSRCDADFSNAVRRYITAQASNETMWSEGQLP